MSVDVTPTGFGVQFTFFSQYGVVNGNQYYRRISTSYSGLDANLGITPPVILRYFPGGANPPTTTPYASATDCQNGEAANVNAFLVGIRKPWERIFQAAFIDYYAEENVRFVTDPDPSIDTGGFASTPFIPAGYKHTYTDQAVPDYGTDPFDGPGTPPPLDPDAVPNNPFDPDSNPPPIEIPPSSVPPEGALNTLTIDCCSAFNKKLTDSSTAIVYLKNSANGLWGAVTSQLNVAENQVSFDVSATDTHYFVMFSEVGLCKYPSRVPTTIKREPQNNNGAGSALGTAGLNAGRIGASSVSYPKTSELKGMSTRLKNGRPEKLTGKAKLESDISFIVYSVLKDEGLLKRTLTEADKGFLSKRIKDELEDPRNWWYAQSAPISLSSVKITRKTVSSVGGISITGNDDEWFVYIGYTELSTGVQIDVDSEAAIIVPFGAQFPV